MYGGQINAIHPAKGAGAGAVEGVFPNFYGGALIGWGTEGFRDAAIEAHCPGLGG